MSTFTFSEKGFSSNKLTGTKNIYEVIDFIKNHPRKDEILYLRSLNSENKEYKNLKGTLPIILPHGTFYPTREERNLKKLSQYLYFDIDLEDEHRANDIKSLLLENFYNYIVLIGHSVGGKGLFFYIKVKRLTKKNFKAAQWYFINEVFKDFNIDKNALGINRCHVLPYDEGIFFNIENKSFTIPERVSLQSDSTLHNVYTNTHSSCYTSPSVYRNIQEVWDKIVWETIVDVGDKLFIIEPIDIYKLYFPHNIKDGKKHSVFRGVINSIMVLNPQLELLDVLSFINFINYNYTTNPMKDKELINTVTAEYNRIKETGEIFAPYKTKRLHMNKNACISREEKRKIANKVNGLLRTFITLNRVLKAKEALVKIGVDNPTNKSISQLCGVSADTVSRYKGKSLEKIYEQIMSYNQDISDANTECSANANDESAFIGESQMDNEDNILAWLDEHEAKQSEIRQEKEFYKQLYPNRLI